MENKKALVTLMGVHRDEKGNDAIELSVEGRFGKKGKAYKIEYDETEMTGMHGTHTTILANQNAVALRRTGTVESFLSFYRGRKQVSYYDTPQGRMVIGIDPFEMDINMNEQGGKIHIAYHVEMDHVPSGDNFVDVEIHPIYE